MRYFSSSIVLCLLALHPVFGQVVSGRITDAAGKPVEYVNVGVRNSQVGLISSATGMFSLSLPDSLQSGDVVFSHLSFEPVEFPVSELNRLMAEGEELHIVLSERAFEMKPVQVVPGRPKYRLYQKTVRIPMVYFASRTEFTQRAEQEKQTLYDMNKEIGTVYTVKQPFWLHEISFEVSGSSLERGLIRLVVYRLEGGSVVPLHTAPVYFYVEKARGTEYYTVDVVDDHIVCGPGEIAVGLELVERVGEGSEHMSLPAFGGGGFLRKAVDNRFEKVSITPGISLYGRVLPR